jgi:hypothetical protein
MQDQHQQRSSKKHGAPASLGAASCARAKLLEKASTPGHDSVHPPCVRWRGLAWPKWGSGRCGRVVRLPRRLSPSHGLRSSCRNIQPVANYRISLLPSTVYSCTHYFPPFMLPDSLHGCASVFDLIPLSSRYKFRLRDQLLDHARIICY